MDYNRLPPFKVSPGGVVNELLSGHRSVRHASGMTAPNVPNCVSRGGLCANPRFDGGPENETISEDSTPEGPWEVRRRRGTGVVLDGLFGNTRRESYERRASTEIELRKRFIKGSRAPLDRTWQFQESNRVPNHPNPSISDAAWDDECEAIQGYTVQRPNENAVTN